MNQKSKQHNNIDYMRSVAIIGGGIGGLALGYYLSQKGYKITIFERKKTLGGFLETIKYQDTLYESYYHHIFLNDIELLGLINELGLGSKILWRNSSSASYINGTFFPTNSLFDWLRFPGINLIDKAKCAKLTHNIHLKNAQNYHSVTAYKFIGSFFGLSFLNSLWKPLFEKKFSNDAKNISAAWFISRLQKRTRKRTRGKEILGYMEGSFQLLIDKLHSSILQNDGKIELFTTIKSINKNKTSYTVDGKEFDFIVSTVANQVNIFKNILPQEEIATQSNIPYFGVICASIISKNKLSDYYWVNILDKSIPFVSFIEQTNLFNYKIKNFHLSYLGWYLPERKRKQMNHKKIIALARETIKKMFPGLKEELSINVAVDKYAQPVISAKIKTPPITTSDKNIFITNMDHIFPHDRGLNEAVIEAQKISRMF